MQASDFLETKFEGVHPHGRHDGRHDGHHGGPVGRVHHHDQAPRPGGLGLLQ